MYDDRTPADVFISQVFQRSTVTKLINGWRVDPIKLQNLVSLHLKDLGILFVGRDQQKSVTDLILHSLTKSKEIRSLVKKAEVEENERKRSRHAEV